ncbi:hypothetical protein [Legionella feeleii]|uniref:hypothetical protein n=1 Tax=Legionella feeleii TaxID=453 RepID=UPI0015F1A476|nr:hypothetical protein [Legionella feeleii]
MTSAMIYSYVVDCGQLVEGTAIPFYQRFSAFKLKTRFNLILFRSELQLEN